MRRLWLIYKLMRKQRLNFKVKRLMSCIFYTICGYRFVPDESLFLFFNLVHVIFQTLFHKTTPCLSLTEKKIYKCNLGCSKSSHYHCCSCKKTIISRNYFTEHIHKCGLSINMQVSSLCSSSMVPSTTTASCNTSAPLINTSVPIRSDNNGSDPQCSEDSVTGSLNVLDIKVKSASPPSLPGSLTAPVTPSYSQDILMSVNPTHNICAGSLKVLTSRPKRITCCFCNLILNKKNIKVHIQRRHMSANPDLLQTNGLSHTHAASGLVFSIFQN